MVNIMSEADLKPSRAPVVWLVNEGGHPYEKAEKFGRIIPVTVGTINVFNPDRLMVNVSHRLRMAIDSDYVAISGSPVLNGLMMAMWLKRFERMNLLLWSHRDTDYKLTTITRSAMEKQALLEAEPLVS